MASVCCYFCYIISNGIATGLNLIVGDRIGACMWWLLVIIDFDKSRDGFIHNWSPKGKIRTFTSNVSSKTCVLNEWTYAWITLQTTSLSCYLFHESSNTNLDALLNEQKLRRLCIIWKLDIIWVTSLSQLRHLFNTRMALRWMTCIRSPMYPDNFLHFWLRASIAYARITRSIPDVHTLEHTCSTLSYLSFNWISFANKGEEVS